MKQIRYLRAVEELVGEGDHAVHEVGFDEFLPDVALPWQALRFGLRRFHCAPRRAVAGLAGGHAAIGEDEAGHALGREVVEKAAPGLSWRCPWAGRRIDERPRVHPSGCLQQFAPFFLIGRMRGYPAALRLSRSARLRRVHVAAPIAFGCLHCVPAVGREPGVAFQAPRDGFAFGVRATAPCGGLEAEICEGVGAVSWGFAFSHRRTLARGARRWHGESFGGARGDVTLAEFRARMGGVPKAGARGSP